MGCATLDSVAEEPLPVKSGLVEKSKTSGLMCCLYSGVHYVELPMVCMIAKWTSVKPLVFAYVVGVLNTAVSVLAGGCCTHISERASISTVMYIQSRLSCT